MADFATLVEILTERFDAQTIGAKEEDRFGWVLVPAERIVEVCTFLRDDERCDFDFLRAQSALDLGPEGGFGVVYHLISYKYRHELVLRVVVGREVPAIPSVVSVWPAANWHEREAFDLMGIDFPGHPDLRRIMLPDDWEGHPLRKDYVDPPTIYNIPTQRAPNLEVAAGLGKPSQGA
jgi:NADH-quinone oxidoreductase subunit C